jgi:hypothetical protein
MKIEIQEIATPNEIKTSHFSSLLKYFSNPLSKFINPRGRKSHP